MPVIVSARNFFGTSSTETKARKLSWQVPIFGTNRRIVLTIDLKYRFSQTHWSSNRSCTHRIVKPWHHLRRRRER
jgi:hypothetical protein